MRKRGDPTWSVARDDAQEQKKRPGGEPYKLSPCGDLSPPKASRNDDEARFAGDGDSEPSAAGGG